MNKSGRKYQNDLHIGHLVYYYDLGCDSYLDVRLSKSVHLQSSPLLFSHLVITFCPCHSCHRFALPYLSLTQTSCLCSFFVALFWFDLWLEGGFSICGFVLLEAVAQFIQGGVFNLGLNLIRVLFLSCGFNLIRILFSFYGFNLISVLFLFWICIQSRFGFMHVEFVS